MFKLFRDPVPDMHTAIARAREGAKYLDGMYGPAWRQKINVSSLDIGSMACICGQLARQYHWRLIFIAMDTAVRLGFSCGYWEFLIYQPAHVRRSFKRLTAAWRIVLADDREVLARLERRQKRVGSLTAGETTAA